MNTSTIALQEDIEITRTEMIQLAQQLGFSNPNVVKCSQKLDSLLNVYHNQIIKR
ncbi:aspartyl-phosphate phosphatase Spo0E family protein [Bacillus sp. USDA818B3_A]|uniref:aspartyl-phosphate phosphatase Spo0E family protein n=1 Tax=Bacillus sp. USDA818B3_A TaxID=2698834 RepID=UPI001368EF8E|nr:aspartyl-phosphate phosphatase Spo0E family protein [Bacillus sp. USDA818B3_A]